jgi:hypothetical protein
MVWKMVVPPLALAIVVFVYDILATPLPNKEVSVPVVIFHDQHFRTVPMHRILKNASLESVYAIQGYITDDWVKENQEAIKKGAVQPHPLGYYQDLLEIVFVNWYAKKYMPHWRVERSLFKGIGGAVRIESAAVGAEKGYVVITREVLARQLQGNYIVQNSSDALFFVDRFCLPSQSRLNIERGKNGDPTKLIVTNPHLKLIVSIALVGGENIQNSEIKKRIMEVFEGDDLSNTWILVTFKYEVSRFRRWSSMTENQLKWIDGLISSFREDFDWNLFLADLKQQTEGTEKKCL